MWDSTVRGEIHIQCGQISEYFTQTYTRFTTHLKIHAYAVAFELIALNFQFKVY